MPAWQPACAGMLICQTKNGKKKASPGKKNQVDEERCEGRRNQEEGEKNKTVAAPSAPSRPLQKAPLPHTSGTSAWQASKVLNSIQLSLLARRADCRLGLLHVDTAVAAGSRLCQACAAPAGGAGRFVFHSHARQLSIPCSPACDACCMPSTFIRAHKLTGVIGAGLDTAAAASAGLDPGPARPCAKPSPRRTWPCCQVGPTGAGSRLLKDLAGPVRFSSLTLDLNEAPSSVKNANPGQLKGDSPGREGCRWAPLIIYLFLCVARAPPSVST